MIIDKAYIVANEQQEREVLEKSEQEGFNWKGGLKPTRFIPKKRGKYRAVFPYALINEGRVRWCNINQLEDEEIIFDGRKEERPISIDSFENSVDKKELIEILKGFDLIKEKDMSDKYVVSQKFMNALEWWKINYVVNSDFLDVDNIGNLPPDVSRWWIYDDITDKERNNRLIAILRWVNGEDVFEVEKPKKWVVHELNTELYVTTYDGHTGITPNRDYITKFDTKEEAQSWANSHQEVIEVEE